MDEPVSDAVIVQFAFRIEATYVMSPDELMKWYGQTAESLAHQLLENPSDDETPELVTYRVLGYKGQW